MKYYFIRSFYNVVYVSSVKFKLFGTPDESSSCPGFL